MRPMIVHSAEGEARRLNPFQVIGWRAGAVPVPRTNPPQSYAGTIIQTPGGPVGVRESEDQIDWLFMVATGERVFAGGGESIFPNFEVNAPLPPGTQPPRPDEEA